LIRREKGSKSSMSHTSKNLGTETALPRTRIAILRHDFASVVSTVIHPLLFPLLTLIVISMTYTHGNISKTTLYSILAVLLTAVPVALIVYVQVKRGAWSDLDVSQRKQRYALYPLTLVCLALLTFVYARLHAPVQATIAVVTLAVANIINGIVNLFWKISAHATTAAMCASLLWQLSAGHTWGPPAAAGAALVGWSRVELKRHTAGQVVAGWLVGTATALLAVRIGV
jgi:membrane-associated phospholipid phosphatase